MSLRKVRILIAGACLLIILVVLGFSAWLSAATFKKNYVNSLVAGYTVAGGECRRKIEYAVKYGKPLTNFYGMRDLLQEVRRDAPDIKDVRVVLPDGRVVCDLEGATPGRSIPREVLQEADFSAAAAGRPYMVARYSGSYSVFLPVYDKKNAWIGSLNMVFDQSVVDTRSGAYIWRSLQEMAVVAAAAAVLLMALLIAFPVVTGDGQIRRRRVFGVLLAVIVASQVFYGLRNISLFKEVYYDTAKNNTRLTAGIIQKDIGQVLQKGVPYSGLAGIEDWLGRIVGSVPEIESISISGADGAVMYSAGTRGPGGAAPPGAGRSMYSLPLNQDRWGTGALINIYLSGEYVDSKIREIKLDTLTVMMTSLFFSVEILVFLLIFLGLRPASSSIPKDPAGPGVSGTGPEPGFGVGVIRPLAFIFYMATDLSISFIPMQMKKLYEPILGLPSNVVLGMPISAEMFCASLTAIVTGYVLDRKGWRFPFFTGLALLGAGALLSGLSRSAAMFILARGIVGIGYGFSWMAMRGYVAANPTEAARALGFSQLNAGLYAANVCACVTGAMLAERLGFSAVFFITASMLVMAGAFALAFVRDPAPAPAPGEDRAQAPAPMGGLWGFLGNKMVLFLFFLITIPSTICLTGFLNYFFPLYSNSLGLSPSNTGRAFMIYGICIIYLGPFFGRIIGRSGDIRRYILLASLMGAAAMMVFSWRGGIAAAVVAILLLGLADSIGFVSQNTYFLSLEATRAFGQGKALGLFSMAKKIGQMLGPLTFGWLAATGAQQGVGVIGATYIAAILVFFLVMRGRPPAGAKAPGGTI